MSTLPTDIQAMSQTEALLELGSLDRAQATRGLSPAEQQRLIHLELRLEQFASASELAHAQELMADPSQLAANVENPNVEVTETVDLSLASSGARFIFPMILGVVGLAVFRKKKGRR